MVEERQLIQECRLVRSGSAHDGHEFAGADRHLDPPVVQGIPRARMAVMEPLIWQAYEYERRTKTSDWYWAIGILTIGGVVTAAVLGNLLFSVFILIAGFTIALHGTHEPHLATFEVNRHGILVDAVLYPYQSLRSFWVEDREGPRDMLIIRSQKMFMTHVALPIEGVPPLLVREHLLEFLPEEHMREPLVHKLVDHFGF
jgi:hypothetical protein